MTFEGPKTHLPPTTVDQKLRDSAVSASVHNISTDLKTVFLTELKSTCQDMEVKTMDSLRSDMEFAIKKVQEEI